MFGLDPLSRSVAVVEMLFLLALAALIGWLLGRWVRNGRVHTLRSALADKQTQLATLRRTATEAAPPSVAPTPVVVSTSSVVAEAQPLRPTAADAPTSPPFVEPLPASNLAPPGRDVSGAGKPPVEKPVPPVSAVNAPVPRPDESRPVGPDPVLPSLRPANRSLPNSFLPGNTEAAVLNRIALRADELNFDRIGRATAADADDLKDIVGIGPFLERKLHSLGIYTYRQIANFTKEDSEQVNDIIEFFPGRVERDNWVGQAKQFHERKHGART